MIKELCEEMGIDIEEIYFNLFDFGDFGFGIFERIVKEEPIEEPTEKVAENAIKENLALKEYRNNLELELVVERAKNKQLIQEKNKLFFDLKTANQQLQCCLTKLDKATAKIKVKQTISEKEKEIMEQWYIELKKIFGAGAGAGAGE